MECQFDNTGLNYILEEHTDGEIDSSKASGHRKAHYPLCKIIILKFYAMEVKN